MVHYIFECVVYFMAGYGLSAAWSHLWEWRELRDMSRKMDVMEQSND